MGGVELGVLRELCGQGRSLDSQKGTTWEGQVFADGEAGTRDRALGKGPLSGRLDVGDGEDTWVECEIGTPILKSCFFEIWGGRGGGAGSVCSSGWPGTQDLPASPWGVPPHLEHQQSLVSC